MIELRNVWKRYGENAALRDVTVTIPAGEAALLTGPSGAGKSTLLRLLFAAERADEGEVLVAGRDVGKLRRASIPFLRRNIGVVFQDFKLLRDRTAAENVAVALEVAGMPRRKVRARVEETLTAVGLSARSQVKAGALSGGEQQRVAIARALAARPAILIADEPTGNLDQLLATEVLGLLERLRDRGTTMIVATHDPDVIRFGTAHGWRRIRLDAGVHIDALPDVILDIDPTGRNQVAATQQPNAALQQGAAATQQEHGAAQHALASLDRLDDDGSDGIGDLEAAIEMMLEAPPSSPLEGP